MPDEAKFEVFMQRVMQREMPANPMARIRTLARELAEGTLHKLWDLSIYFASAEPDSYGHTETIYGKFDSLEVREYLERRWKNDYPDWKFLHTNGYISWNDGIRLEKAAYDLIEEAEPADVFVSYRRKDSSAFAMFVLTRLKMAGLNAYLDMAILAGDDWRDRIKAEIEEREYFVLLLGRQTLSSDIVCDELTWAWERDKKIIPIWHNGYRYIKGKSKLKPEVDELLDKKNAIRVLEESGLGYNNAIVELLNRFGITP